MLKRFLLPLRRSSWALANSGWGPWGVFGWVLLLGWVGLAALQAWQGDVLPGLKALSAHTETPSMLHSALAQLRTQVQWVMGTMCFLVALAAGLVTHWVGVARRERLTRSVADALRDEAQAAQREAVAASQDKAQFLGMLSHELLTPLQTILSTLGVIEGRGGVDVADPTFTRLKESTRVLRSRMSDLVDFAKLSVGQLELRVRAFTPMRLLTMLVDDYTEALLEKNLDLHWEPSSDLLRRIYSDPTRIRQILENILSNAIKYTERGGITLNASLEGDLFRVEIADSGVGIAADQLPHVFEPFYRVKTSAHLAVGSGLGLAVVRSLVDMLQGRIDLRSEWGHGVHFVVKIPVSAHPAAAPVPAESAGPASVDPVLVVDDDPGVRHSMADVVRALGWEAVEVSNGRTALQEAQQRSFSAIFCDVQLPDISGVEVAQQIRQGGGPNGRTCLVQMSAFPGPDERAKALFDARIDKPVDSQQVSEVLASVQKRSAVSAAGGGVVV